jgi:phage protein D
MSPINLTGRNLNFDRPAYSIEIDNVDVIKHGLSVQSVVVILNPDSFAAFSIVFTGNAVGPSFPSLVDDDLLAVGRKVSIKIGYEPGGLTPMFVGEITNVKTIFPADESPTVEIVGDNSVGIVKVRQRRNAIISKRYGEELLSFTSEMDLESLNALQTMGDLASIGLSTLSAKKNEKRKRSRLTLATVHKQSIIGIGECLGDPEVVPGRKMKLDGLGERFSGQYRLTGAIHSIDSSFGYRTTFSVTKV